jgi:hypothetical protein
MSFSKFLGNCPRLAPKDAKYSIRWDQGEQVVSLIFRTGNRERIYLATKEHRQLVNMVNAVKEEYAGTSGGVFYINEWRQVIVPTTGSITGEIDYYYAGEYDGNLEFNYDGQILSGRPLKLDGRPLCPGDEWQGPHPGIRYKLRAGGKDVSYVLRTGLIRTEVCLADGVSPQAAGQVASRIRAQRDERGGRFYLNEWRAMFTPVSEEGRLRYVYVGQLEDADPWFPKTVVAEP